MPFKTDIHCHLAPGIDDGQRHADEAASLVEAEIGWGVDKIFCTPHITQDTFENTSETISQAFDALKAEVESRGLKVALDYSAEHRLDGYFLSQLEKGAVRPLPNSYILVENSYVQEAWNMDQMLFDLRILGLKPILAHPERYSYYFGKYARYEKLHQAGTLFQVNILSFAGYYGKQEKQTAEWLLENDLVDFLGTDMHHARHCQAINDFRATKEFRKLCSQVSGRILNDKAFV